MTLHQKINELNELGFGIKFEKTTNEFKGNNIMIKIRFQREGSSVVFENTKHIIHAQYMDEPFVVSLLESAYHEIETERWNQAVSK